MPEVSEEEAKALEEVVRGAGELHFGSEEESIAGMWDSYLREVLPKDAPEVQVRECRLAFHAGSWSLLQSLVKVSHLTEEEGARRLQAWEDELLVFSRKIAEGG